MNGNMYAIAAIVLSGCVQVEEAADHFPFDGTANQITNEILSEGDCSSHPERCLQRLYSDHMKPTSSCDPEKGIGYELTTTRDPFIKVSKVFREYVSEAPNVEICDTYSCDTQALGSIYIGPEAFVLFQMRQSAHYSQEHLTHKIVRLRPYPPRRIGEYKSFVSGRAGIVDYSYRGSILTRSDGDELESIGCILTPDQDREVILKKIDYCMKLLDYPIIEGCQIHEYKIAEYWLIWSLDGTAYGLIDRGQ